MQTPLRAATATPSQQRAAAARRERARKIAARAHPDSQLADPKAPAPPQPVAAKPSPARPVANASGEPHQQAEAPRKKTWFWIVEEIEPPLPLRLSIEEIQAAVERHCQVTRADLVSARRHAAIVRPRQIAMFLARHLTLHSLPVIGRKFGHRDHTTVLHAVRKIERLRHRDTELAADLETLGRALAARVA
jgi:hypothetical protein